MNTTPTTDPTTAPSTPTQTPDAVVAVYLTEDDLTHAIKHLERAHYDMSSISVLGKGIDEERHIVGFDTPHARTNRWAKWGGMWGWIFGAFFFVPGVGHVAVGGYLLFMLFTAGVGAAGGALGAAMTSVGIPEDRVPIYEADLRADRFLVIAHGEPADVERARVILTSTEHHRIDHHRSSTTPHPETDMDTDADADTHDEHDTSLFENPAPIGSKEYIDLELARINPLA